MGKFDKLPLHMEQPRLGNTIAILRRTKGLTQEELAQACGINVRSLQRIESGEVMPRMYTLRQLSHQLGHDLLSQAHATEPAPIRKSWWEIKGDDNINMALKTGWIGGIIYFLLSIPETIMIFWRMTENLDFSGKIFYTVVSVAVMVTAAVFYRGFIALGSKVQQPMLTVCSWLLIALTFAIYSMDVYYTWVGIESKFLSVVELMTFGFSGIFFGIGLTRTESELGNSSRYAGILEIVSGVCFVLIITSVIGLVILLPAIILEIIVLYKACQVFHGSQSKSSFSFGL